ncbi:MAG TPA: Rieske 2Fe-2S domain-containing protein [Steroidobacteraceae bacterium]
MSSQFHVSVARARTPEASFYTDADGHAREVERVFGNSWQLVGRTAQLAEPGDFFTTEVCGESLLVVNDTGTLRAFLNVCRHRAGPIAQGCGHQKLLFACRYRGGRGHLRASAPQPAFARVSAEPPLATARERRASFPRPAPGLVEPLNSHE